MTGLMSWLPSPVTKERTTLTRSASLAILGKVAPKVTPGRAVLISPVALRVPTGADILGSNVSVWLGPPCRKRKMTERSWTGRLEDDSAVDWAESRLGKDRPPRDS